MSAGIACRVLFPPAAGSLMLIPSCQSPDSSGPIWSPASRLGVRRWPRWIREEAHSSSQPVGPFPTASSSLFGLSSLRSILNLLHPVGQTCLWLSEDLLFCPCPLCCRTFQALLLSSQFHLAFQMELEAQLPGEASLVPCLRLPFLWLIKHPSHEFTAAHVSLCRGSWLGFILHQNPVSGPVPGCPHSVSSGLHVVLGGVGLGVSL